MIEEYRNALPEGTIIDTYQIEKILGVGGFGITYLVKELNLGKRYAIKELLPDGIAIRQGGETTVMARSTSDQDGFDATRKYFISEAQVLAGMDHPAVVSVHRLMEANGTCYMVMDYIKGDTLGDYLKKQGEVLSGADEFKQIFFPLMAGLKILHGQGIIHRDIKPGNIMIQPDGAPVLLDFGAATQVQSKTMTITQMLSGGYSPFEQYTTRAKQGPYTDIYALGATMLTAITGKKPDDASDRVYNDQYQPLAENEAYSTVYEKGLLESIDASLLMDAQQRPQNIVAWRGMMERQEQKPKVVMAPKPQPGAVPEPEYRSGLIYEHREKVRLVKEEGKTPAEVGLADEIFDPGFVGWVNDDPEAFDASPIKQEKEKTGQSKMVFLGSVTLIVVCVIVALVSQQRRLDPKRQSGVGMVIEDQAEEQMYRRARENLEELEQTRDQLQIQIRKLIDAPNEDLIRTAAGVGVPIDLGAGLELPENQVTAHYTSYLVAEEQVSVMIARGLGPNHPEVKAAKLRAESALENAGKEVALLKDVLETRLNFVDKQVEQMKLELPKQQGAEAQRRKAQKEKEAERKERDRVSAEAFPKQEKVVASLPITATKERPFSNSLRMKFAPVKITGGPTDGQNILFSIWETRRMDYEAFAKENRGVNEEWKTAEGNEPLHPVVNVNWDDANAFCAWLTRKERAEGKIGPKDEYRLPTDHEWSCAVGIGSREDAAASPDDKITLPIYPWGEAWPPPRGAGNLGSNLEGYSDAYGEDAPVGSFRANPYGLRDLSGNVREWCQDRYSGYTQTRVARGSAWGGYSEFSLRSGYRWDFGPRNRSRYNGFRCVLVLFAG